MEIWKILRGAEYADLLRDGRLAGAPVDLADGYIHFSTPAQASETLTRHFAGADGLWLVACDAAALGDALRWEPSRGGAMFPHLYRPLGMADVLWARPIHLDAGGRHVLP